MPAIQKSAALALGLASIALAQTSSVINVFFPDVDQQTLVGSLIHSDASKTTVAIGCPSGTDSNNCGFGPDLVTATFGSSTLVVTETVDSLTVEVNCKVIGTTAATCVQTFVGPEGYFAAQTATDDSFLTSTAATDTRITSSTTTTTLSQSEISFMPITLTAFANAASATNSAHTTSTNSAQTTGAATGGAAVTTQSGSNDASSSSDFVGLRRVAGLAGLLGIAVAAL